MRNPNDGQRGLGPSTSQARLLVASGIVLALVALANMALGWAPIWWAIGATLWITAIVAAWYWGE